MYFLSQAQLFFHSSALPFFCRAMGPNQVLFSIPKLLILAAWYECGSV